MAVLTLIVVNFVICIIPHAILKTFSKRMVHDFITSEIEYCYSLLYSTSNYQVKKLLPVTNASAQLIFCAPKF